MLYWSLMFLFVALAAGLLGIAVHCGGRAKNFAGALSTHSLGLGDLYSNWVQTFASESSGGGSLHQTTLAARRP